MKQEQITAKYIDHSGSDLMVVNAARASFGKDSEWDWDGIERSLVGLPIGGTYNMHGHKRVLKPADANLIRFLATGYRTSEWDELLNDVIRLVQFGLDTNNLDQTKADLTPLLRAYKRKAQHWAPFGHPHLTLRMSLPIFLARQFVKHQIGGTWSEESRRYISDEPGVWFTDEWHTRPEDIKQGSGGLVADQGAAQDIAERTVQIALDAYDALLAEGVAPEEARTILPLNMMTTVVWTGSLLFWSRVVNQRVDGHAQLAAQELGKKISAIVAPHYPVSWEALTN